MDYDEHCSLGRHNLFIISVIWHFLVVHVLEDPSFYDLFSSDHVFLSLTRPVIPTLVSCWQWKISLESVQDKDSSSPNLSKVSVTVNILFQIIYFLMSNSL